MLFGEKRFVGQEVKFQLVNVRKSRTDMSIVLARDAMEGQLTEVLNFDTGKKRVNWQPQRQLTFMLTATWKTWTSANMILMAILMGVLVTFLVMTILWEMVMVITVTNY